MNCDCVQNLEKDMVGQKFKDREIRKATFLDQALLFVKGEGKSQLIGATNNSIEVYLEGLLRPQKISITHNFCPFCGTKISKEIAENESETLKPSDDASKN